MVRTDGTFDMMSKTPPPFEQYLPSITTINGIKQEIANYQVQDIIQYMGDPSSHADITPALAIDSNTSIPSKLTHIDGFETLPLYQSSLVSVQTGMSTRIGGRGIVANEDIQPGALLFCEYIRFPFSGQERPELEFIQQFVFDLKAEEQTSLVRDLSSLFPFAVDDIEPQHRAMLDEIYGDFLHTILEHSQHVRSAPAASKGKGKGKGGKKSAPVQQTEPVPHPEYMNYDTLLTLICKIHFNSFPSGILLHTSMCNHSCVPNAVKLYISRPAIEENIQETAQGKRPAKLNTKIIGQPTKKSHRTYSELRATRFIPKGEEVFISYIPDRLIELTYRQRQFYLYRQFRFRCTCTLCLKEGLLHYNHVYHQKHIAPLTGVDGQHSLVASQTTEEGGIRAGTIDHNITVLELSTDYLNIGFLQAQDEDDNDADHPPQPSDDNNTTTTENTTKNDDVPPQTTPSPQPTTSRRNNKKTNPIDRIDFREKYHLSSSMSLDVFMVYRLLDILAMSSSSSSTSIPLTDEVLTIIHQLLITCCNSLIPQLSSQSLGLESTALLLYVLLQYSPQIEHLCESITPTNTNTATTTSNDGDNSTPDPSSVPQSAGNRPPFNSYLPFSNIRAALQITTIFDDVKDGNEPSVEGQGQEDSSSSQYHEMIEKIVEAFQDHPLELDDIDSSGVQSQQSSSSEKKQSHGKNKAGRSAKARAQQQQQQQPQPQVSPIETATELPISHITFHNSSNIPLSVPLPYTIVKVLLPDDETPRPALNTLLVTVADAIHHVVKALPAECHHIAHNIIVRLFRPVISTITVQSYGKQAQTFTRQVEHITASLQLGLAFMSLALQLQRMKAYHSTYNNMISPKYSEMLDGLAQLLQYIISHGMLANKLFRHPLLTQHVGKGGAGDLSKFERQNIRSCEIIGDLFNQCAIETLVDGI